MGPTRVATGMESGVLTQVITQLTHAGDETDVSKLTMSAGALPAGQQIDNLPEITARRHGKGRSGGKDSKKDTGPKLSQCKVGAPVVVERRHLDIRVRPGEPGRNVLNTMNKQDTDFYGHMVSKPKHQTWNVKIAIFPSEAPPVPTDQAILFLKLGAPQKISFSSNQRPILTRTLFPCLRSTDMSMWEDGHVDSGGWPR